MRYEIESAKSCDIIPCKCGTLPKFMTMFHHTDCWLQCPMCGTRTVNTGGYHYAEEIPLSKAKLEAAKLWNAGDVYKN